MEMTLLASAVPGISNTIFGSGTTAVPSSMSKPIDPSTNILNSDGFVTDQFSLSNYSDGNETTAQGLLDGLQSYATSEGPSASAQYQMDANAANTQANKEQAIADSNSATATNQANLSMKGGLGTGTRERMANSAATNLTNTNNSLNQQQNINDLGIMATDEAQKLSTLQSLPSQYLNLSEFNTNKYATDISNSINTSTNAYNQQMNAWAANQSAIAQANAANAANSGLLSGLF